MTRMTLLMAALLLSSCCAARGSGAEGRSRRRLRRKTGSRDASAKGEANARRGLASDPSNAANDVSDGERKGSGDEREAYDPSNAMNDSNNEAEQQQRQQRHQQHQQRELATHPDGLPYRLFRPSDSRTPLSSVLGSKSLRQTCELVTLQFAWPSPSDSQNTAWILSLGDLAALESAHPPLYDQGAGTPGGGGGTIVDHSVGQYRFQEGERHSLCLPGPGEYTLTVFDRSGGAGGGEYALLSDDGRVLASSEGGGVAASSTFVLPPPPLATPVPSASPAPTASSGPSRDCEWIEIDVLYDMYPEETTWMVIKGDYSSLDSGNITVVEESANGNIQGDGISINIGAAGGSSASTKVCLQEEGTYSFVIFDSYYNGICCEFGEGKYTITSPSIPGEIIGQGGEFTTFDITTFSVPLLRPPSSSPSSSPYPTISHSPTVECKFVEVRITFDAYSGETSWEIRKQDGSPEGTPVERSPYYDGFEYGGAYTAVSVCLPGDGVYTFTIADRSGDGICCAFGEGRYELAIEGEDDGREYTIAEGGVFEREESATFAVPYYGGETPSPSSTPAPSVECYEVEASLTFDRYPYETIWLIVEGGIAGQDLNDDWSLATVAESPKYGFERLNTTDVRVECLPSGKYTFLIVDSDGICCQYGQGEYAVTLIKKNGARVVIKEGGDFSSLESVTFDLPYVAGSVPTMSPNAGVQAPTSRFWVDIDLSFDSAPYQVSWVITDENSNVVEESPYYSMFYKDGSESHRVDLSSAGQYTFVIKDTGGNGVCCSLGNGSYQVTVHDPSGDVVVGQGSDFGAEETVTFSVQGNGGNGPTNFPTPVGFDFGSGDDYGYGYVYDGEWPTPAPSEPPVRQTSVPTEAGCTPVNLKLMFDVFPYDTHWWLVEGDLNTFENNEPHFIGKSPSPSYDVERFENVTHSFCLSEGKYSFMIFDDSGNGMCCKAGEGSYTLTYGKDNEEFAKGGKFGFFDVVVFEVPFPTRSPSWTPAPTTLMPTTFQPTSDTPAPSLGGTIPDCEILLDLTTETDGEQSSIRWEVALGDQSSVENNFALIVAQSEESMYQISKVGQRTSDSDKVCLPGEGQYTFTIFDSNSGGDTQYRLVVDGALIAYGSDFGFQDSTTFMVPVSGQPTPAPQPVGLAPSPAECTMIDISINFDDFPDETYWRVYAGNADEIEDAIIVAESPFYLNVTENSTSHQVCLPGDGEYTFAIYDNANDGMCCNFGKGGYVVTSVDDPIVVVAEGGKFTDSEVTTFSVPIMVAPSTSPTLTPQPTKSFAPTVPCSSVELTLTFDAYPSETVWTLFDANNDTVAASPFYPNTEYANRTIQENFCLPDGAYLFLITDQAGDGNCCVGLGDGSYSLVYHDGASDIIIVDNGPDPTFVYYDSADFAIPYVVPPTRSPTISPAPTESLSPTARCVPMELVINFDAYPSDTLWEITFGDTSSWDDESAVIAEDSPIYSSDEMYNTVRHSFCLPAGEDYTFTVFDATGNGMCCEAGTGGYILLTIDENGHREIIAEGAEFEWSLSTQFDLPLEVGPRIDGGRALEAT